MLIPWKFVKADLFLYLSVSEALNLSLTFWHFIRIVMDLRSLLFPSHFTSIFASLFAEISWFEMSTCVPETSTAIFNWQLERSWLA